MEKIQIISINFLGIKIGKIGYEEKPKKISEFLNRIIPITYLKNNPDKQCVYRDFKWSHLGSNQGLADYESATLTN